MRPMHNVETYLYRIDVAGRTIYVKGRIAMDHLSSISHQFAKMRLALYKIKSGNSSDPMADATEASRSLSTVDVSRQKMFRTTTDKIEPLLEEAFAEAKKHMPNSPTAQLYFLRGYLRTRLVSFVYEIQDEMVLSGGSLPLLPSGPCKICGDSTTQREKAHGPFLCLDCFGRELDPLR